jgi:hypothetical protein
MGKRVRRVRARGRRVVLWAAACYLVVQAAAGLWLEVYGTRIRFPELVKVLRAAVEEPPPSVAFLGSSRTMTGVDAAVVTERVRRESGDADFHAFEAGIPLGDSLSQDRALHELLCLGRRPAVAVIEVSPEFLGKTNLRMSEHVRRQVRFQDACVYVPEAARANNLPRLLSAYLAPLHVHRYHLLKEVDRLYEEGWERWHTDYALTAPGRDEVAPPATVHGPADNARLLAAALAGDRRAPAPAASPLPPGEASRPDPQKTQSGLNWVARWLRDYQVGGAAAAALESVLERCRRHGIVPILVELPVIEAQRALYTPAVEAAYRAHLGELCARYGCVFIDARGWCPDEGFEDNHHLADSGRRAFSERFAREVLGPVWREMRRGG